jgi:hypothetical protein
MLIWMRARNLVSAFVARKWTIVLVAVAQVPISALPLVVVMPVRTIVFR